MISHERYLELKANIAKFEAWRGNRTSYYPSEVPKDIAWVNNDHRSQVEVYEFVHQQPEKYFAYVKRNLVAPGVVDNKVSVTTWTGQILGYGYLGSRYFCGRSARYPIRFTAINGVKYSGTYFVSSGDYCRVKKVKYGNNTNRSERQGR